MIRPLEKRSTQELFIIAEAYVDSMDYLDDEAFFNHEKDPPQLIIRNMLLNILNNRIGVDRLMSDGYLNDHVRII